MKHHWRNSAKYKWVLLTKLRELPSGNRNCWSGQSHLCAGLNTVNIISPSSLKVGAQGCLQERRDLFCLNINPFNKTLKKVIVSEELERRTQERT